MPSQPPVAQPASLLQILVVDDDTLALAALARSVRGTQRLRMHAATDSASAIEITARASLDVAIVDLILGSESGVDLIARLRFEHPALRIAAATAAASRECVSRALAAGAEMVLQKPFTLAIAAHALELEHLELRQAYEITHASLELVQWEHVRRVHTDLGGNILRTARVLGVSRTTVKKWLEKERPPG